MRPPHHRDRTLIQVHGHWTETSVLPHVFVQQTCIWLRASDLRAGAAMVVAALMADGTSEIEEIGHIERGYENIVEKLRGLGAEISKVERVPAALEQAL